MGLAFTKFEEISLKSHPELDEIWVQDRIAEDPSILKLGNLYLKDRERRQPKAGRLDLLLQDEEEDRRYEVEIQLGPTDESHIIRTIEYWDIERKRYPQYEHVAVIIAEDITSRFLNVISLFNNAIPLVAIQMKALKNGNQVGLSFTTVLTQASTGLIDEDDEAEEIANRSYWEKRVGKTILMVDEILELAKTTGGEWSLEYKKGRIILSRKGERNARVILKAGKILVVCYFQIPQSEEITNYLDGRGVDTMSYKYQSYRVRLRSGEIAKYKDVLAEMIQKVQKTSEVF